MRGTQGLRGLAKGSDLVLDGRLGVRIWAVVVADEDVGVDVAHADVVVWLAVALVDAVLVARDAGVNNAGS